VPADTGAAQSDQYFYTLITAWNFMFLVPELADYLRQNALEKVQDAVDRYTRMAPYWMAGHNEEVQHENGITPLYQTHALFQARAQILQASRDELAKFLDTPVVPAGDLFYLQNLVATLEASGASSAGPGSEIVVQIDWNRQVLTSHFEIGVTHTHAMWENGHPEAVARVKRQLEEARIRYQNQHLMGWGANNPEPSPGVYNWSSLDRRLELIRSMTDTIPVITFCTAPGWMKASGKDWNMEERVADEHVQDFADLCRAVALRYPDVEYFQIWNEFKGYWTKGGRDVEGFTVLYNAVYDAVQAARPDAKIGGPYLSMGGRSLSANDRQVMNYWRQHGRGSDFLTFDGWLEGWPPGGKTEDWMMGRTRFFGDLVKEFQTMTERPVWISEFYGGRSKNPRFTAANHASCYYHALRSGARLALLWDGVGLGQLFTGTQTADGGQPTPHYSVVRAFNRHFGPGTQLYQTKSSSDDIEVLASRAKIMLINKRPKPVTVRPEGKEVSLDGYGVRVLDAPGVGLP
jgi:hypothetical protein